MEKENNFESIFENKYVRDKSVIKDFYCAGFLKHPLILGLLIFSLVSFVIILVSVVASILTLDISNAVTGLLSSLCCLSIPLIVFLRYILTVRIMVKRDKENNGSASPEIQVIVTEDGIRNVSSSGMEVTFNYDSIKKIKTTKKLIVLITKAKQGVIFKKDSFIKGTPEELIRFLRSKGIK